MRYPKWLITTLSLMLIFAALVVAVNFYIDHHAIRLSLFNGNKEIQQTVYPDGINQHIFNPERIFRNPEKFNSFLFGSSRVGQIDVAKISSGKFYNMYYSLGLTSQHLAILKAFINRGVKIKTVVIGLDEISFNGDAKAREKNLVRIMHPDAGGPNRLEIFGMYFFRKPDLKELSLWKGRVLGSKIKGRFDIDGQGFNLGWRWKDEMIDKAGKPIFNFTTSKYEPMKYDQNELDKAFAIIEELLALAREHHFSLIFFINPFYEELYLDHAQSLLTVKERLAKITDYYDFSGFNSVTTNAMNYYEKSHYRYRVGDLIIERIFGDGNMPLPDDFGVLVTQKNVGQHIEDQKRELEQYLRTHNLR
jgi:hypothetical protein